MDIEKDHYATLGLRPDATAAQIKQAFRKKALVSHPDRGGSHVRMRELNEAWGVLGDPAQRREYDSLRACAGGYRSVPATQAPTGPTRKATRRAARPRESLLVKTVGSLAMSGAFALGRLIRKLIRLAAGRQSP